ncbi:MAG: hypothetical protein KBG15_22765, partial [Kofleriaceae bacterium]|nr:hypothetical protein [Kofleriaceae bacterium]
MIRNLFALTAALALVACSDSAAVQPDAAASDAPPATDGAIVDGLSYTAPTPFAIPLSVAGPDQLQAAIAGPNDTFYAAGFAAQTLAGSKAVTVVKLSATGLVAGFGTAGIATTSFVSAAGSAGEIALVAQASGKIVVVATVANASNALDRDIVVFRLDGTTGALDTTFGTGGSVVLDLNTALDATVAAQRDA